MTLNSGATITDASGENCWHRRSLDFSSAVMADSGATVNVGSFTDVGGVTNNGANFQNSNSTPVTGSPSVKDPYQNLSAPNTGGMTTYTPSPIGNAMTLNPGYYPNGINFNGGTYTVTLNTGVYDFGSGINIGSGVTIEMNQRSDHLTWAGVRNST